MVQSLRSHRLTSSDVANQSVRAEESCCFGNQGSISEQSFELAQTLNFDSLASYPFPEIELENEYDHKKWVIQFHDELAQDPMLTQKKGGNQVKIPESLLNQEVKLNH